VDYVNPILGGKTKGIMRFILLASGFMPIKPTPTIPIRTIFAYPSGLAAPLVREAQQEQPITRLQNGCQPLGAAPPAVIDEDITGLRRYVPDLD